MRYTYDKEADAAYFYVKYPIGPGEAAKQVRVDKRVILDFNAQGMLIGVEVLSARKVLGKKVTLEAEQLS